MRRLLYGSLGLFTAAAIASAQSASLNTADLALRSSGSFATSTSDWQLSENGYLGTYITLAQPGTVSFTINASGLASGGAAPRMNLAIGDFKTGWDVAPTSSQYATSLSLPAGTHFVRTEFSNDIPTADRRLTINNLQINGATAANVNSNANARALADTYIQNFRRGQANVALRGPGNIPLLQGTEINAKLGRHAFNWGTNIPGSSTTDFNNYLVSGPNSANFRNFINSHFNAIVPSNYGKWSNNESTRDVVTMDRVDGVIKYARDNNMRTRSHNQIWGAQQPTWANTMLTNGSAGSLTDLRGEITERIDYSTKGYVDGVVNPNNQRADFFTEIDVYNESWHTGFNTPGSSANYWDRYQPAGVASIYQETRDAIAAAGSNAKVFVNEYNILQNGPDEYGNWYRNHIEQIQNADGNLSNGPVQGIGMQYYGLPGHNASYMQQVLQNTSINDYQLALTEFGVQNTVTDEALTREILRDSMRMMFGSPQASGFFIWGFWAGATSNLQSASVLVDQNFNLTNAGKDYEDLLGIANWDGDPTNGWNTNLNAVVNADGSIDFTGFFGDYTLGGQAFAMNLVKGTTQYQVQLAAPPDWHFWNTSNDGSFTNAANWTNGMPNGIGKTAHFGPSASPRSVTVDLRATLGQINFDSTASYTLSGTTGIILDGPAGVTAINVANGSHTISSPMGVNDDVAITIASPASTLDITGSFSAQGKKISKVGPGALQMANVRAGSLEITGGTVRVSEKPSNNSPTGTSSVNSLSVAPGATFDLANNAAAIDNSSPSTAGEITTLLAAGYNGGAWNGSGIASSSAAAASTTPVRTAIGVADATDLFSSFPVVYGGVVIDSTSLLLQYTVAGDANLDSVADIADFSAVAGNFNQPGRWFTGDFNYDGTVDIADFAALAANFNQSLAAALPRAAVPEPAVAIVLFAPMLLCGRRSRGGR